MIFPRDVFDGSIKSNMPASEFLKVINDLNGYANSLVADISVIHQDRWTLNYDGMSVEITSCDDIVTGINRI